MASLWRDARSRLAARPGGPSMKLRILQAYVDQDGGHPPRFCMKQLPFSKTFFKFSALLLLGKMPVQRVNGMYLYKTSVRNFCQLCFGKCICLHCFLPGDTLVFDSEWHWLFDCTQFSLSTSLATFLQASRKRANIFKHVKKNCQYFAKPCHIYPM